MDHKEAVALRTFLPQALVPVVLDVDSAGIRYCDSILWSIQEQDMSPEQFASTTCADLQLPSNFASLVASSIRQQLQHAWALIRHAGSRERASHPLLPRHVVLRVDVLFNGQRFRDDIRWDTRCPRNTPESVARQTCTDLSLLKPFDAAIAFAMRRELMRAALGCAAVDPSGTARLAAPASLPRQDSLMHAWRPRSLSVPLSSRNGKAVSTLSTNNAKSTADKNNGRLPHDVPALSLPGGTAATPQGVGTMTHISGLDATLARSGSSSSSCVDPGPSVAIERAPRAINPYIMFSSRHRGRVAQENPTLNTVEISRIMGELWRSMAPEKRELYEHMAREENAKRLAGMKRLPVATDSAQRYPPLQMPQSGAAAPFAAASHSQAPVNPPVSAGHGVAVSDRHLRVGSQEVEKQQLVAQPLSNAQQFRS